MARGQVAGLRGNNKVGLHLVQRGEATVEVLAAVVGVRGVGQTTPNARGTLRAKLQPNLPGETV